MMRGITPFWIRCCCTIALRADEQRERVKPRPRQGGVGWVSTDSPQDGVGDACTDHLQGAAGELFAHPLLRRHEGDADGCTRALQDLGVVRVRGEDCLEHGEPFGGHEVAHTSAAAAALQLSIGRTAQKSLKGRRMRRVVAQPQLAGGGGVCREDRRAGGPVKFDDAGTQRATSNEVAVAGSRDANSHRTRSGV